MRSRYRYDAASRLRQLRHDNGSQALAQFDYQVDARGNRIQATELLATTATPSSTTTLEFDHPAVLYNGDWSDDDPFKVTTRFMASMQVVFFGRELSLTVGTGPDHGIFDVYLGNVLWQSLDGYAASDDERTVNLVFDGEGPHVLKIRNRAEHHPLSTGFKLRFKEIVAAEQTYDYELHTITYLYDGLARLQQADYSSGLTPTGDPFRRYEFAYDVAGNRTQQVATIAGTPTETNFVYDAANRLTTAGGEAVDYDAAGQLTDDNNLSYTWDRAGRLLSAGDSEYAYNGLGQRLSQTVSTVVTEYLLDTQPGLYKVLAATTNSDTTRYIHDPMGIHAQQDPTDDWTWTVQDGLGSVRGVVDEALAPQVSQHFAPYGDPWGVQGSNLTVFGFTGEQVESTDLVYLRARYYNPALGVFPSLDPLEGNSSQPMSLNRYGYVAGNVVNRIDPSGMVRENPGQWNGCWQANLNRNCDYCLPGLTWLCEEGLIECPPPPLPPGAPCSQGEATATIPYSGDKAASAGTYLAVQGRIHVSDPNWSEGLDSSRFGVDPRTSSARFISLALSEGDLPMTDRWYANCVYGKVEAQTSSWTLHDNLVQYLTGGSPKICEASESVEVLSTTLFGEDFSQIRPPREFPGYQTVPKNMANLQALASDLQNFRSGDYVFGTYGTIGSSAYTSAGGAHGFLVVGTGPALPCNESQLDFIRGNSELPLLVDTNGLGFDVPYIADLYGVQRGTPRPFYCALLGDYEYGNDHWFEQNLGPMNRLVFYKMPTQVTVNCGEYRQRHFSARRGCSS